MVLLTNRLDLSAATSRRSTKQRWLIEMFFKRSSKTCASKPSWNKCQCRSHPDLDSTHHHPAGQIPAVQIPRTWALSHLIALLALESVQLPDLWRGWSDRFKLHRSCRPKTQLARVLDSIPYHRSHTQPIFHRFSLQSEPQPKSSPISACLDSSVRGSSRVSLTFRET